MSAYDDSALAGLATRVGAQLSSQGQRLVTAESCTGGYVAKLLTDIPGSSSWFECGYVCYSNRAKHRDLDVSADSLQQHGAVSEQVVLEMARGALGTSGADRAIAISGVAGPDGGTPKNPVGSVWFARAARRGQQVRAEAVRQQWKGSRDVIRRRSAAYALEWLLEN